jgi:hypothetical protein
VLPPALIDALDADDGWTDPVDDRCDRTRINVERRLVPWIADRVFESPRARSSIGEASKIDYAKPRCVGHGIGAANRVELV